MSSGGSNAGVETPVPLVNDIVNNAEYINHYINQTLHQIIHILHFCPIDSLLNYASDFVVSWIDAMAVRQSQIWKFVGVTTIS